MQSDLESDISTIPAQSLYKAQGALLVQTEMASSQPTDVISGQQGLRGQKRPSSTVWRLILMLGDVVLLAALFGSLLVLHLVPQVSTSTMEIREVRLIWICLALVSWGLAVNMTQSQNLSYASNRFKGPCCTIFALVLMYIFWMLLSRFLLGIGFVISARLELFFLGLAIPTFAIWRFLFVEVMCLPRFHLRTVIVGVNAAGETIAKELQSLKHSNISILGYIDESTEEKSYNNGLSILGDRSVLRYLVYNAII